MSELLSNIIFDLMLYNISKRSLTWEPDYNRYISVAKEGDLFRTHTHTEIFMTFPGRDKTIKS